MYKAPLVFVDESSDVSKALEQLVASCNEIGTLICELIREVNSSGEGEASPSATDDEEDQKLRAEPKSEGVVTLEKKKAVKDIRGKVTKESKKSATIIDLSLSDEEKETPVKDEPNQEMKEVQEVATIAPDEDATEAMESPIPPANEVVAANENFSMPVEVENSVTEKVTVVAPPPRRKARERKAPTRIAPPVVKRAVRDVVVRLRKRAEMVPSGLVGTAVCSALNAAIAVEENLENTGVDSRIKTFVSATAKAGQKLVEVHAEHPVQTERHLEDMRLLMSVAVVNLEGELSADAVKAAWKLLKALQQLHEMYLVKTKGLHRDCLQLYKTLAQEHKVPADEVKQFKAKLDMLFVEVDEWMPLDGLTTKWFDKHVLSINELLDGSFEGWDPRSEPILGKTVSNLERICTFGIGDEWNDRYASICLACSKMSRTTFFWTVDLTDKDPVKLIRCNQLEPGFEDKARVKSDFDHVTSYEVEVHYASGPSAKKAAFDELIDRLRWIFNAVAMTTKQSLVPLNRLKRLNECFSTLIRLCDYGNALNLEGCIHLEKLLVVMRQVMYIRIDYAGVSKRATDSLLGLFPHDKRPRFVYPEGCHHTS